MVWRKAIPLSCSRTDPEVLVGLRQLAQSERPPPLRRSLPTATRARSGLRLDRLEKGVGCAAERRAR